MSENTPTLILFFNDFLIFLSIFVILILLFYLFSSNNLITGNNGGKPFPFFEYLNKHTPD